MTITVTYEKKGEKPIVLELPDREPHEVLNAIARKLGLKVNEGADKVFEEIMKRRKLDEEAAKALPAPEARKKSIEKPLPAEESDDEQPSDRLI